MAFFCTSSQRAKLPALPLPLRFLGAPCRCQHRVSLDTDPMPHLLLLNLFTTLGHRTPLEDWLRDTLLAPARPLQLPSCSSEFLRSKLPPPLPHSPLNLYGIASLIENLLSLVIAPAALRLPRWHSMATTPEDAASDDDFLQDTPDSLVLDRQSSDDHQPPDLGHGETTSLGTPGEPASSSLDRPYQPINAGTPRGSSRAPDAADHGAEGRKPFRVQDSCSSLLPSSFLRHFLRARRFHPVRRTNSSRSSPGPTARARTRGQGKAFLLPAATERTCPQPLPPPQFQPQTPANRPRASEPSAPSNSLASGGLVTKVAQLLLRHEDYLNGLAQSTTWVMFQGTSPPLSIIPAQARISEQWQITKTERPSSIRHPLRTVLFQTWASELKARVESLDTDPDRSRRP